MTGTRRIGALLAGLALTTAVGGSSAAGAQEGPPLRPDTRPVMFVGNNWEGTADIIDARNYRRLARINTIPDREARMAEIMLNPQRLAFFLAIRQAVGEGNDQFTDDMFTSHDGRFVYVSRPSFADVVGIDLRTGQIVWRFPMEGQRSDHMAISPDGKKLLISDSTANKVHELDARTGQRTGQFPSGDSPHENNYSDNGSRIFHASIGRVYTPTDAPELGLVRDTTKGERYFQIVDARTLEIIRRVDMGERLAEAGYPDMESAVRPMAIAPGERVIYLQISFHHGFVEYDVQADRVTRVIDLPVSEEAKNTPREQYLLDSAHHGLAINPEGTKLCAAGTMSDYSAIVRRGGAFPHKIFQSGKKPYWSTNGLGGDTCWVSASADDHVAILDYAAEKQITKVPVGDHPQRVRLGAVQHSYLAGLPLAAGARDRLAPQVEVRGASARSSCRRTSFRLRVSIADQSSVRSATVTLGSRRLRTTRSRNFSVQVPVRGLRPGSHVVRVSVTDSAGNRRRQTVRFSRCAYRSQINFTG